MQLSDLLESAGSWKQENLFGRLKFGAPPRWSEKAGGFTRRQEIYLDGELIGWFTEKGKGEVEGLAKKKGGSRK